MVANVSIINASQKKNQKPKTQKQEASTKAKMKQNHTTHTDI